MLEDTDDLAEDVEELASRHCFRLLDKVLASKPDHYKALTHKAILLMELGEDELALRLLKQSLAITSSYVATLTSLGSYWQKHENRHEAQRYFKKALQRDKTDFVALMGSAQIYVSEGKMEEALSLYETAIKLFEDDSL